MFPSFATREAFFHVFTSFATRETIRETCFWKYFSSCCQAINNMAAGSLLCQNSKKETEEKSSKMANFLGKLGYQSQPYLLSLTLLGFTHVTNSLETVTIRHLGVQTVSKEEFMWESRDCLLRCCRLFEQN